MAQLHSIRWLHNSGLRVTAPTVTTTATPGSDVGSYTITVNGAADPDYTFNYVSSTLTITKANQTIHWSNPTAIVYGTPPGAIQLDATVSVVGPAAGGALTYTPATGTLLTVGNNQILTVRAAGTKDYNAATATVSINVLGPGSYVIGGELWLVGANTNDQVQVAAVGSSNTGNTGIKVAATLNRVQTTNAHNQSFTFLRIFGYGGNDTVQLPSSLTINAAIIVGDGNNVIQTGNGNDTITVGNGNDTIQTGNGNETVTAGNGNDTVQLGDGNNTVAVGSGNDTVQVGNGSNVVSAGNGNDTITAGKGNNVITVGNGNDTVKAGMGTNIVTLDNGSDTVRLGDGNNTVAVGSGNDTVQVGNGSNVVLAGNGNDTIAAGKGNNLIVAGLGRHTVQVGNGSNILIDGSVKVTNSLDSLRQVLDDWTCYGDAVDNVARIRARLAVTYNSKYANTLSAGTGLDWFWETYSADSTNRKPTDILN